MPAGSVLDAVTHLRAAVDAVLDLDMSALDGLGIAAVLEGIESARRRLDAADVRALAVAEDRRLDGQFAAASLVDVLVHRLRLDAAEARRRVRRYQDLGPRHTLTGEPLPPILPATSAALLAGQISGGHADAIGKYTAQVDALPDAQPDDAEIAEALLLRVARHDTPTGVARTGQQLLARLDQDGTEPADERIARRRGITFRDNPDGSSKWEVFADAELTALRGTLLDTLAAPIAEPDGEPDPRSPAQRRHDALRDALRRVVRSGDLPVAGGVPTTVLAHLRLDQLPVSDPAALDQFQWDGRADIIDATKHQITDQLPQPTTDPITSAAGGPTTEPATDPDTEVQGHAACGGYAVTGHGGLLSGRQLGIDMCEAEVDILVTSPDGAVLAFGRSTRLATRAQRIVLAGRDGGCSFPGCTRPPAWCEAHHVIPWLSGGRTNVNNMCLVCPYHHRRFEQLPRFKESSQHLIAKGCCGCRGGTSRFGRGWGRWVLPRFGARFVVGSGGRSPRVRTRLRPQRRRECRSRPAKAGSSRLAACRR